MRLKLDEWDQMIDVNIKGVLYGIAAALPIFQKAKLGQFINVASVAELKQIRRHSPFVAGTKVACQ